jgi:cysteine dioxygenase
MDTMSTTALDPRLRAALAPLAAYLESLPAGSRAEPAELARILSGLDRLHFGDLESWALFSDAGYQRVVLAEDERFEVLLMGWKPGQQSPIHDHARSVCGARVVRGTATETRFRFTPSGGLRVEGRRRPPDRELRDGEPPHAPRLLAAAP